MLLSFFLCSLTLSAAYSSPISCPEALTPSLSQKNKIALYNRIYQAVTSNIQYHLRPDQINNKDVRTGHENTLKRNILIAVEKFKATQELGPRSIERFIDHIFERNILDKTDSDAQSRYSRARNGIKMELKLIFEKEAALRRQFVHLISTHIRNHLLPEHLIDEYAFTGRSSSLESSIFEILEKFDLNHGLRPLQIRKIVDQVYNENIVDISRSLTLKVNKKTIEDKIRYDFTNKVLKEGLSEILQDSHLLLTPKRQDELIEVFKDRMEGKYPRTSIDNYETFTKQELEIYLKESPDWNKIVEENHRSVGNNLNFRRIENTIAILVMLKILSTLIF